MKDGDSILRIEIGKVDDVGTATEGAERWGAGGGYPSGYLGMRERWNESYQDEQQNWSKSVAHGFSSESSRGNTGIQDGSLELEVKDQTVDKEILNVKWHVDAVDGTIVRKVDFDRDVDQGVVVGMDVESYGGGQKCCGV